MSRGGGGGVKDGADGGCQGSLGEMLEAEGRFHHFAPIHDSETRRRESAIPASTDSSGGPLLSRSHACVRPVDASLGAQPVHVDRSRHIFRNDVMWLYCLPPILHP